MERERDHNEIAIQVLPIRAENSAPLIFGRT